MRRSVDIKNIKDLPKNPGIYFLKNKKGEVFYVGKSTNVRTRVRTHSKDNTLFRPEKIDSVEYIETANEIEALLKESEYIKKMHPKMNVRLRDDKQYFYVGATKEELPRLFITHQPANEAKKIEYIGPYTDGAALKQTMKYLRRLFPYYPTNAKRPLKAQKHKALPCSWCHLGLCPGPDPDKSEYKKNIRAIKNVLKGRRSSVVKQLEKEMKTQAKAHDYEKAGELRDTIDAVENIFSHQFVLAWQYKPKLRYSEEAAEYLAELIGKDGPVYTIEGYDVSNIQGKEPTASMVRFDNGAPNKSLYRRFNIYSQDEPNDYLMMKEVVHRRFKHSEWPYPDLVLIDGGRGQLNAAQDVLREMKLNVPVISLSKAKTEARRQGVAFSMREEEVYLPNRSQPIPLSEMPKTVENVLKHIRDESHRFAITHHRKKHSERFQN